MKKINTIDPKLSIAYFGTPYFSARFLEKLLMNTSINPPAGRAGQLIEVKLVVTQPDKPIGRKQIITPSPVKLLAQKHHLKILEIENWDLIENLKFEIENLDMAVIYAYGFKQLIPKKILESTRLKFGKTNSGFINIHPSLLPKYRGASPIAYPLIMGDKKTGVSLFVMDEKMDHGPIIAQDELSTLPTDRRPDLEIKLTDLAFTLFKKICTTFVRSYRTGTFKLKEQNHSRATHASYLSKNDGFIPLSTLKKALRNEPLTIDEIPKIILDYLNKYNLTENWKLKIKNSSKIIYDYFRGIYPWPGIWTLIKIKGAEKRLKIIDLAFNNSRLTINRVQLEGKKEVDFKTFIKAYNLF